MIKIDEIDFFAFEWCSESEAVSYTHLDVYKRQALTCGQALQQAKAGIEAVYLSGWQVACLLYTSRCV